MRVVITPPARADSQRIYLFNKERSVAWAEKVRHRLADRMRTLATTPQLGRSVHGQLYRRFSVTDIQYVIDYERLQDGIRVLRIRHSREVR